MADDDGEMDLSFDDEELLAAVVAVEAKPPAGRAVAAPVLQPAPPPPPSPRVATGVDGAADALLAKLAELHTLDEQLARQNEQLEQVMVACQLRDAVERSRLHRSPPPILCHIQVDWLSTATQLVTVRLSNRSLHTLTQWALTVDWSALDEKFCPRLDQDCGVTVRRFELPDLPPGASFRAEVFSDCQQTLPLLIGCHLSRCFAYAEPADLSPRSKTASMPVHRHVCTVWDVLCRRADALAVRLPAALPAKGAAGSDLAKGCLKMALTERCAFMLCADAPTVDGLFSWLLPRCPPTQQDSRESASVSGLTLGCAFDLTIEAAISRLEGQFVLTVQLASHDGAVLRHYRAALRRGLCARLLVSLEDARCCPKAAHMDSFLPALEASVQHLLEARADDRLEEYLSESFFVEFPVF